MENSCFSVFIDPTVVLQRSYNSWISFFLLNWKEKEKNIGAKIFDANIFLHYLFQEKVPYAIIFLIKMKINDKFQMHL